MSTGIVIVILLIAGMISGCIWISYYVLRRAKKAYWKLYHKVVHAEQHIEQIQQQIIFLIDQQANLVKQVGQAQVLSLQVQQHLLLEHLSDLADMAVEKDLISSDAYDKSVRILHELKIENLQGNVSSDSVNQ